VRLPVLRLRKIISTKFAKSGSPAVNVIKKFSWTAQDQKRGRHDRRQEMKPDDAPRSGSRRTHQGQGLGELTP